MAVARSYSPAPQVTFVNRRIKVNPGEVGVRNWGMTSIRTNLEAIPQSLDSTLPLYILEVKSE
jgi:hypothetical protein